MTDKTSTAPVCTDDVIRDWAERHDIFSAGSHLTDARAAFEDAASLTPTPDVVGGDVVALRIVGRHGPYPWFDASLIDKAKPPELIVGEGERVEYAYATPRVQGDVDVRRVAEALAGNGWASGGDFEDDFLPDVRSAISVALAAQPKGDVSHSAEQTSGYEQPDGFDIVLAEGNPEFISGYLLGESPGESGFWLFHPNGRNYNGPFESREEALAVANRLPRAIHADDTNHAEQTRGDGAGVEHMSLADIRSRLWASRGLGGIDLDNDEFQDVLRSLDFHSSPRQAVSNGWQPIETAPKGVKVIAGYRNQLGKWRSVMARYYGPCTLELADDQVGDDDGFAPADWYEETETHETTYLTDEVPTHWMRLAAAPPAGRMGVDRG